MWFLFFLFFLLLFFIFQFLLLFAFILFIFSHFVPQQIEDKDVLSTSVSGVRPHQDDAYVQVHTFFSLPRKNIYTVAKKYWFGHVTIAILYYGVTVLFLIM